jgi:hypothetical protein
VLLAMRLRNDADLRARLGDLLPAVGAFAVFTVLTLREARFLLVWLALAAVAGGAVWAALGARRVLDRGLVGAVAAVLFLYAASDTLFGLVRARLNPGDFVTEVTLGDRIAAELKARGAPVDGPRSGVFAPWIAGHHILLESGVPAVLTPFGSMLPRFDEKAAVVLEPDAARAVAELDRLGVRWVALAPPVPERTFAARLWNGGDAALSRLRLVADKSAPEPGPFGSVLPPFRLWELLRP